MLKNLSDEAIQFITDIIKQYWSEENCCIETWYIQKLISLYKGKGDIQNLNNQRVICLKETIAMIVSSIVARQLLNTITNLDLVANSAK